MTCLTVIQSAARRLGQPVPVAVVSSTDGGTQQLLELLNEEGGSLAQRNSWTALQTEATFTTVATESQGALSTIAPNCKFIINDTIYNRTLRKPVFGPLSPQTWQQRKSLFIQGPWNQFRVRGGNIIFIPAPSAGQSCYFEYITKAWATDSTGATPKTSFTSDTDLSVLDEELLILGLVWRWRSAKGLDYSMDMQKYERAVLNAVDRDGSKPTLSMTASDQDIPFGVFVPSGGWMK